jgi:hypothetical protein
MHKGQLVFTQLCSFLPKRAFDCLVEKYEGNKYVKSFTCWNHLLVLIFGQLSHRESLRDLIVTLCVHKNKFHHLGIGKSITRSNLSKANEIRSVRIFEQFSMRIIEIARSKRANISDFFIKNKIYAFDSSIITFCIKTFWWSNPHQGTGGIKLHTLYDVKANIPSFNLITDHLISDSSMMDAISYEADSFYIFDKAYVSTPQLYKIHLIDAFFIVRKKNNMRYKLLEDKNYNNPKTGVMADQIIKFTSRIAKKGYPEELRYIVYYSKEQESTLCFLTNNTKMIPEDIASLYKYRWRIEVFFKWIKQHLRIKEFYGTSENAVKIQIYSAIIAYCLVAIVQKELNVKMSTYEVLRILSVSLFEKIPIKELFKEENVDSNYQIDTQLNLNFF